MCSIGSSRETSVSDILLGSYSSFYNKKRVTFFHYFNYKFLHFKNENYDLNQSFETCPLHLDLKNSCLKFKRFICNID